MKILSIFVLFLYYIFTQIIQPLTSQTYLPEFTTFIGSLIGALGSITGGIITGIVAFRVAHKQFVNDSKRIDDKETEKRDNFKRLIMSEIKSNNSCLNKLDNLSSTSEIKTALKYSISNEIYRACSSQLEVDDFFYNVIKYHRILDRLITDESIHNEESLDIILAEIDELTNIEECLIINPTTN